MPTTVNGSQPAGGPRRPPRAGRREERFALTALAAIAAITTGWWALALWPTSGPAPDWLARTRLVCFGIEDSGMPDAGGWVALVGSPLGMLALLLAGWAKPLLRRLRRLTATRHGRLGLAAPAVVLLLGATAAAWRISAWQARPIPAAAPFPIPETYPRLDRPAPSLGLLDQHGERLDLERLRGRPVLVTFAYGHCETVCPLVVHAVLEAQKRAGSPARANGAEPVVVVITLDPWRDTPSQLFRIAERWGLGTDAHLLGGEPAAVNAVLDAWEVPRSRDRRTGEITHPSLVYLLDQSGRIAYAATGRAGTLVALVRRL